MALRHARSLNVCPDGYLLLTGNDQTCSGGAHTGSSRHDGVSLVIRPLQALVLKARSSITWELVKNANFWIPFQTNESEILQVGCGFIKAFR